jgi:tetratricopeptide (TPR) repeat protein
MELINSIFDKMEAQGVATNQNLLYGYFFYDSDKSKLEQLKKDLAGEAYKFVALDKKDDGTYMLHVEKTEQHTRTSLFNTEQHLELLAAKHHVSSYDGFDIGNTDPSKPLISNEAFLNFISTKKGNELFDAGIKLYNLEMEDKAALVFEECIKQKIKRDTAAYKLGNVLINQHKVKEGIQQLGQATKINPKYVAAFFNLGATCYDNMQFKESVQYYQQAEKLQPDDDRIIHGIAASQYALQQYSQSLENCRRALQLNKNNENAQQLLQMLNGKIK